MAWNFNGSTDRVIISSGLFNYNDPYVISGYFRIGVDQNAYTALLNISNNSSHVEYLGFDDSAGNPRLILYTDTGSNNGTEVSGTRIATGVWTFFILRRSSTTSLELYLNGSTTADITNTRNVAARSAASRLEFALFNSGNADPFNGDVAHVKIRTGLYTVEEIVPDMWEIFPSNFSGIWGIYPTFDGATERVADYSGNGRNFTEGGTITDAENPGIKWQKRRLYHPIIPITAGGNTYDGEGVILSTASITGAGVLNRQGSGVINSGTSSTGQAVLIINGVGQVNSGGVTTGQGTLRRTGAGEINSLSSVTGDAQRVIGSTGQINSSSSVTGQGVLALISAGVINSAGVITGAASLLLRSAGVINSDGSITGSGSLIILTGGQINSGGVITGTGYLLRGGAGVINSGGSITGRPVIVLVSLGAINSTSSITGNGVIDGPASYIDGAGIINSLASISGGGVLVLSASGEILSAASISGAAQRVRSGAGVVLSASSVTGRISALVSSTGVINSASSISGLGRLIIASQGSINSVCSITGQLASLNDFLNTPASRTFLASEVNRLIASTQSRVLRVTKRE